MKTSHAAFLYTAASQSQAREHKKRRPSQGAEPVRQASVGAYEPVANSPAASAARSYARTEQRHNRTGLQRGRCPNQPHGLSSLHSLWEILFSGRLICTVEAEVTHDGLQALKAELILEGDGEAVERAYDSVVSVEMVIDLSRALQGTFDEDLCQAVCLSWKR